ncbi:MAG: glycosyltransferase family 2 protein [Pelagimonas sp.]|nr:glycosyltransferase family 2 protein [Pelagimonas sp.]
MGNGKYTVMSTMKNESPYILDWIAHHKVLGFDDIIVCSNDCTDPTDKILLRLQDLGFLTHHATKLKAGGIHRSALRQANRYDVMKDAEWVYITDADEYLNIHIEDGSVQALIEASGPNADVISVPWRLFGSAGIEKIEDTPVTEQFRLTEKPWDADTNPNAGAHQKSLYTNPHKYKRLGIHQPIHSEEHKADIKHVWPGGSDFFINGERTENPPSYEVAQVNHYAVRSMNSYMNKRARGRANHMENVLGAPYWFKHNINDMTDTSIDRYKPKVEKLVSELKSDPILADLHEQAVDWHQRKATSLMMDPELEPFVEELRSHPMHSARKSA